MMREAVIVAAVRTPVGKARGCYAYMEPEHLGAVPIRELLARTGFPGGQVDDIIYSTCRNLDMAIPGHLIGLTAGLPMEVPGFSVDRGCASSLNGFAIAATMIRTGIYDAAIAGGVENSTRGIYKMNPAPQPFSMAPPTWVEDKITPPEYENLGMGATAERIAQRFGITREECDRFALLSHQRATAAWEAGRFDGQIVPVAIGVALKCFGSAPACYLILAMLADVIDHIEYRRGIRTDGLTMSIYSSIMVAGTPVCNAIFSGILNAVGYNQSADVALGTAAQSAAAQSAITISYIWVETVCYAVCALLILFWTVEKNLPAEQAEIARRKG